MAATNSVILQASSKHTSTLIFLHGLGDTGHGWVSAMGSIRPPHMKVMCPTAPTMPVTLNAGFEMPSWFDLKTLDVSGPEDEEGIRKATQNIHSMIDSEVKSGIASNRIMLGGFSQGGALALFAGLTYPQALGGIMALSCWLPMHKMFPGLRKTPANVPVFQCHGDCDPVVPYKFGQLSSSVLKTFMTNSKFTTYSGLSHSSNEAELDDMKTFIEQYVTPQ